VSNLRGRLGAFQTFTIGSTVSSLGVAYENVSAAESAVMDTDFRRGDVEPDARPDSVARLPRRCLSQANAQPDKRAEASGTLMMIR
jgi:flagellin